MKEKINMLTADTRVVRRGDVGYIQKLTDGHWVTIMRQTTKARPLPKGPSYLGKA